MDIKKTRKKAAYSEKIFNLKNNNLGSATQSLKRGS